MVSRRRFVGAAARAVAGGLAVGAGAPLFEACERPGRPPLFETVVDVSALAMDGQSLVTPAPGFDGAPILITRRSAARFSALSTQCTHEGCPVNAPTGGIIRCPCHGSQYDLEGKVLQGPALYPLAAYAVTYHRSARRLTVRMDA